MRKPVTPLIKGLITGGVMLAVSLAFYFSGTYATNSSIVYLMYALYAGGIIWTLLDFTKWNPARFTFGQLFNQGFRCFIVVTLIMVVYTAVIFNLHPEWADEAAKLYREGLATEEGKHRTPEEINNTVEQAKKGFVVSNIAVAIFGYLITGALITAVAAGFILTLRRNK